MSVSPFKIAARRNARKRIRTFRPGDAVVRGLAEPVFIHVSPRECSHGGGTPLTEPVEVPDMARFSEMLEKALQEARVPVPKEGVPKEVADLHTKLEELTTQYERDTWALRQELIQVKVERERLAEENKTLNEKAIALTERIRSLEEVPPEKIDELQHRILDLEKQLSEASQLEEQLEEIRSNAGDLAASILDFCNTLGIELIPQDIQRIVEERDELRKQMDVYEATERERSLLVKETLEDPGVKNWMREAQRFLHDLLHRSYGVFPKIMRAAVAMDPEVDFWPEEIQSGVTEATNRQHLNTLASKQLLWKTEKRGRIAFRNAFSYWVTANVRKIRPSAPDQAIQEIEEQLRRQILR